MYSEGFLYIFIGSIEGDRSGIIICNGVYRTSAGGYIMKMPDSHLRDICNGIVSGYKRLDRYKI